MINRFALSFLCIELDRNEIYEVMLVYILLLSPSASCGCGAASQNAHHITTGFAFATCTVPYRIILNQKQEEVRSQVMVANQQT